MGTWNTSVTGNDTAKDLYIEYTAAFYKFDVEEAYIDVPISNKVLMHICGKLGLVKTSETELTIRMIKS